MIGIDITKISRFERLSKLDRFITKFNVPGNDPITAAKTWACLEAIYKAEGQTFDPKKIQLVFSKNQRPQIIDTDSVLSGKYVLTLSHEEDLLVAVAIREK
jgi:phosphopantetheinyl transferase (holo-ACP synthase)